MKKQHLGILLIVLAAAAIWLAYGSGDNNTGTPTESTLSGVPTTTQLPASGERFMWTFAEVEGNGAIAASQTRVVLTDNAKGVSHDLGIRDGSCSEISTTAWALLENEQTGVICWWAGGGVELGVFNENGAFVVKEGSLEEGTAESEGLRGDFKTVLGLE